MYYKHRRGSARITVKKLASKRRSKTHGRTVWYQPEGGGSREPRRFDWDRQVFVTEEKFAANKRKDGFANVQQTLGLIQASA